MSNRTYSLEGPKCPHCGRQFTADEAIYYDERRYTEDECDNCRKKFSVCVNNSTSWTCKPIDPHAADLANAVAQVADELQRGCG